MPPKKGGGRKKGKAPARSQVRSPQSPLQSSSEDESWAMLRELHSKVAHMEAQRFEKRAPGGDEVTPRRSARESKGKRKAELKALTTELTRRFAVLESEQGHEIGGHDGTEGTSPEQLDNRGRKRRKTEAARNMEAGEGTSYGYDPYEDPATYTPEAADVTRGERRGGEMPEARWTVMMVGHSFIYWAARHAAASHWGSDLGLGAQASITWRGVRGMRWIQFGRLTAFGGSPPDILVVHLGGNDLPQVPGKALILDILRDLDRLHALYPRMRIVWSTIIPRLKWRGAINVDRVNNARRLVNKEVCRSVCKRGLGSVIGHHRILTSKLEYFREDGVHLSEAGLDIFLDDLRGGLLEEFGFLGGLMGHSRC
ncbi:uncharacterized protein LOC144584403 [Pogona vitticeps]